MRRRRGVLVGVANLDKERGHDRLYRLYLRALVGPRGVLMLTEVGHGQESVRLHGGVRHRVSGRRQVELGEVGVHRWAATGRIPVGGDPIDAVVFHGLHYGTLVDRYGRAEADAIREASFDALAELVGTFRGEWMVGTDANMGGTQLARRLGGVWHGHTIEGLVLSQGLTAKNVRLFDTPLRRGWGDHPVVRARVRRR